MPRVTVRRDVDAPPERVFSVVADIDVFRRAIPDIVRVEHLSDTRRGVGARFRETRRVNGREASTVLEVVEYVEDERIRLVAEAGGTRWDSTFHVAPRDGGARLELAMRAEPRKLLARLTLPLAMGFVLRALEADMDAVKTFCESSAPVGPEPAGAPP